MDCDSRSECRANTGHAAVVHSSASEAAPVARRQNGSRFVKRFSRVNYYFTDHGTTADGSPVGWKPRQHEPACRRPRLVHRGGEGPWILGGGLLLRRAGEGRHRALEAEGKAKIPVFGVLRTQKILQRPDRYRRPLNSLGLQHERAARSPGSTAPVQVCMRIVRTF